MFLDRVRELVSGSGGDRLISADELASGGLTGSLVAPTQTYLAAPPAPANVSATAAVRSIFVEWDPPAYTGHAYAEVWSASTNSLAAAVLLGMAPGSIYVDDTGSSATRYYWVRFVNTEDVKGPYNATSGATATTIPELEYTMDVLAKEYGDTSEAPFFQLPNPLVIDGVTIAAGTYMKAAYIYNGVITNAKIGNLAVDDAKIANLSVGKLTAGSIAADQYIQSSNYVADTSGFRLDANGNAYLQNAVVRGTVYATAGTFAGSLSAATGTFAGSLSAATGSFAGSLTAATGSFAGSLTAATGSFAGSLTAATGTFSGSLTASAINAVNTINIAGQAVTIPSANTGSSTGASVSVTLDGTYPVVIIATFNGARIDLATFSILRNGTSVMSTSSNSSGGVIPFFPVTVSTVDYPPAGTHTYSLSSTKSVVDSLIFVLAAKR
jgi:hypothetical protein